MIKLYLTVKSFNILDYQVITELFGCFNLFNTQKEVHIHTTYNQPSQNVPAANNLANYNEISATYCTLVRHLFRARFSLCCLLLLPTCLPLKNISIGLLHKYVRVGLGCMCGPALLKEIRNLKLNETLIIKIDKIMQITKIQLPVDSTVSAFWARSVQ